MENIDNLPPGCYRLPPEFFTALGEMIAAADRLGDHAIYYAEDMTVRLPDSNLSRLTLPLAMVKFAVAEALAS